MSEDSNQLSSDVENERLIQFPASKNFPPEDTSEGTLDDPLQDLLDEFSHMREEDLPLHMQTELDSENPLGLVSEKEKTSSTQAKASGQREAEGYLLDQMKLLEETSNRLSYYINEIELYLGKR